MRAIAWILIILTVLCGLVIGYSLWAAGLQVGQTAVYVVPAAERPQPFEALKIDGQWNAVKGVAFESAASLGDIGDYEFHIYQAQVRNFGFLPAQWVEMGMASYPGAILLETQELPPEIPGFSETSIRAVVLAHTGSAPAQQIELTYFVFGRPYRILLTPVQTAAQ